MNLETIRDLIAKAAAEDWNRIEPPYFSHWISWSDRGFEGSHTHLDRAVLKSDLDVAIEWGMECDPSDPPDREDKAFPWLEKAAVADKRGRSIYADVFYRGAHVDRHVLVSVDGSRAYLPLPTPTRADQDDLLDQLEDAVWSWSVAASDYEFGLAINRILRLDLDGYLRRCGVLVVAD